MGCVLAVLPSFGEQCKLYHNDQAGYDTLLEIHLRLNAQILEGILFDTGNRCWRRVVNSGLMKMKVTYNDTMLSVLCYAKFSSESETPTEPQRTQ